MTRDPLSCEQVVRSMWDYVDHAVDTALREAIAAHLKECTSCTAHIAFARSLVEKIAEAPMHEPELAALRARVQSALKAEAASGS